MAIFIVFSCIFVALGLVYFLYQFIQNKGLYINAAMKYAPNQRPFFKYCRSIGFLLSLGYLALHFSSNVAAKYNLLFFFTILILYIMGFSSNKVNINKEIVRQNNEGAEADAQKPRAG